MSNDKCHHTPGPWKACGWKDTVVNATRGDVEVTIALMPGSCPLAEVQANVRLIAAAPGLLAVSTLVLRYLESLAEGPEIKGLARPHYEALILRRAIDAAR